MKQILLLLLMAVSLTALSQKKDLATVNSVKPKLGQKMAFEAAYKLHVAKFHKAEEKIGVYEILSGEYAGYYLLVNGERSFSDFDKERPDAAAHNLDLDKNFFPYLEDTRNASYRFMDSLSLRADVVADKYVVSIAHLKSDLNMADYRTELGRNVRIYLKMSHVFFANLSYAFYEQLWDGSDQVTVSVRNLKDGFKSLEQNYYGTNPPGTPSFREAYTKEYGSTAWDDRVKLLEGAVIKAENYIMKQRKDLSSQ
jgi:hypothetical protein